MASISVFPNWNTNPYLNMLFLEARGRGWSISGGTRVADHLLIDIPGLQDGDVLHIQWTSPFQDGARSREEYIHLVGRFLRAVRDAKSRGVRVLWTVHNLVAHDTKWFDEEVSLGATLADLADRIIVLNSHTPNAAAPYFELASAKVSHLAHPSYAGLYPPPLTREDVRRQIGIAEGLQTIGFVGAIRPYKGVGDFLVASEIVSRRIPRCGVVLAGETSAWAMKEVDAFMPHTLPVFRKHTLLNDDEVAAWMSAVDVMVLPYRNILNSGSMMLAASFGVPTVLPRLPHLVAEFGEQEWIAFFEPDDDDDVRHLSIAAAIETSLGSRSERSRQASAFAQSYTLWDMSKAYADLLDSLVRH